MIRRHRTIRTISPALLAAAFSTAAWYGACAQTKAVVAATSAPFGGDMSSSAQMVGEPLHLLVGRSMFVNTDNRIRRVYVSNPDVLDSFTSSPHQIVITSKTPGLSTLVLWDETGQSRAYLINSDVDVSNLHHALQDAFPTENIRVDGMVDTPVRLSIADLRAMPRKKLVHRFQCVTGWYVPNVHWEGVLLSDVLQRAGVSSKATAIRSLSPALSPVLRPPTPQ